MPAAGEELRRAWVTALRRVGLIPACNAWRVVGGPIAALVASLIRIKWRPVSPWIWLDPNGLRRSVGHHTFADILRDIHYSVQAMLLERVASKAISTGAAGGLDLRQFHGTCGALRADGRLTEAGFLQAWSAGGCWQAARRNTAYGGQVPFCFACGEVEDEFHTFWGLRCAR